MLAGAQPAAAEAGVSNTKALGTLLFTPYAYAFQLAGVVLLLPIFATGVDWIRWWVIAAFDLGVVFLLFASAQPEADLPATRRTLRVFGVFAVGLALLPVGIIPGFGAPVPM